MKLISIITFLCLTIALLSCEKTNKVSFLPLMINQYTFIDRDGEQVVKDSVFKFDTDSFDIGLYSISRGTRFIAEKKLPGSKSFAYQKSISLYIVDLSGNTILFNNASEFLKYMSARGYTSKSKDIQKYYTYYFFKKVNACNYSLNKQSL